jgi:23S rRNA (cytosine1962-C5)-methyltransferase
MPELSIAAQLPVLRLKRNEDRRLHAGHLWVFSNEVDTQQTPLLKFKAGEIVRVLAHNDRALGLAYVNPQSLISARLLSTWRPPDAAWFAERIRSALYLRERLYTQPYYRVVYGEADGLPGLVIDRYGSQCVVQIGTAGFRRPCSRYCTAKHCCSRTTGVRASWKGCRPTSRLPRVISKNSLWSSRAD